MLKILLCDDDRFLLNLEAERIQQEIKKSRYEAEIGCFATEGNQLLHYLKNHPGVYLYFLDLDFGKGQLNGIDLAKQIKTIEPASKIVYGTNHKEMAMTVLSSGVEPFGFLEKTTDMNQLSLGYRKYIQMALSVLKSNHSESDMIQLPVGIDEEVKVRISQITYIEAEKSVSHAITYHTADGSKITVRDTIGRALDQLKDTFVRCHRSVIVNKSYIVGMNNGMIQLSNGEEIVCSIRMRNEVKRWL